MRTPSKKMADQTKSAKTKFRFGWLWRLGWVLFNIFYVLLILGILAGGIYAWNMTPDLRMRFEGKRWHIPSRVYSDSLMIMPGDDINAMGLEKKLERLHYQKIDEKISSPGTYKEHGGIYEVYLRAFEYPKLRQSPYLLLIETAGGRIKKLLDVTNRRSLAAAKLEPELIANFYGKSQEKRDLVTYGEASHYLVKAIVTAEDKNFFYHHGVDPFGLVRAMLVNLRHLSFVQGGSTITQQLIKNFYLSDPSRTMSRKLREAVLAFVLEMLYTKEEIFECYLNEVYFAQEGSVSVCGISEASRMFFGKDVRDLDLGEAALLAGLIRSPYSYNPQERTARAKYRRDLILDRMVHNGFVTKKQADEAKLKSIHVLPKTITSRIAPFFIDFLRQRLVKTYGEEVLISEGLRIFTTLDVRMQMEAEKAVARGLAELEASKPNLKDNQSDPLESAMLVLQPQTGFIRAMVGGRDYNVNQFNRAVQARRQVGSVFKPFVYAAGFARAEADKEFDFMPTTLVQDSPFSLKIPGSKTWSPTNYNAKFEGTITVRHALEHSINVPTAKLALKIGIDEIAELAHRMGIQSQLPHVPSLALGSADLCLLEVCSAYGVFPSGGICAEPIAIKDVVDAMGRALEKKSLTSHRALSPAAAFITTHVLKGVLDRGTGARARLMGLKVPAAGKTGTTDDFRDAWFIGYTPSLLAGVWVGFNSNRTVGLPGGAAALPIWTYFMLDTANEQTDLDFPVPPGVTFRKVDRENGYLSVYGCPDVIEEAFVEGREPTRECPQHSDSLIKVFKNKMQE